MCFHLDHSIADIAHRQHGAFHFKQARELGFSEEQIRLRRESGMWISTDLHTFRHVMTVPTFRHRVAAACLASHGVASHRTAACLHGLWQQDVVEVIVSSSRSYRAGSAIAHRSLDLADSDLTVIDGIPCTNIVRTLLDSGAVLPLRAVELLYDRALDGGQVSVDSVSRRFLQVARRGRRGIAKSRSILEYRDPSMAPAESELEIRAIRVIRSNGLPIPVTQFEVVLAGRLFRIDLAYPDLRIAIELDGRLHNHGAQFDSDRARQNLFMLHGWIVLRFTWPMVRNYPGDVASKIRQAIDLRTHAAA